MKIAVPAFAALLLISGCGGNKSASEQTADYLQAAADQSDPAAAQVLDNAADAVRDDKEVSAGGANATAQAALAEAGNAQAATTAGGEPASPTMGAKPHKAGEAVPSEKSGSGG